MSNKFDILSDEFEINTSSNDTSKSVSDKNKKSSTPKDKKVSVVEKRPVYTKTAPLKVSLSCSDSRKEDAPSQIEIEARNLRFECEEKLAYFGKAKTSNVFDLASFVFDHVDGFTSNVDCLKWELNDSSLKHYMNPSVANRVKDILDLDLDKSGTTKHVSLEGYNLYNKEGLKVTGYTVLDSENFSLTDKDREVFDKIRAARNSFYESNKELNSSLEGLSKEDFEDRKTFRSVREKMAYNTKVMNKYKLQMEAYVMICIYRLFLAAKFTKSFLHTKKIIGEILNIDDSVIDGIYDDLANKQREERERFDLEQSSSYNDDGEEVVIEVPV